MLLNVNIFILLLLFIQESWRLDDLSEKIQVPASVVRKKIAYWQSQGLIEETSTDNFILIENVEQHARLDSGNFIPNFFTHTHQHSNLINAYNVYHELKSFNLLL